jgi:predicted ATPase with chaperone activity
MSISGRGIVEFGAARYGEVTERRFSGRIVMRIRGATRFVAGLATCLSLALPVGGCSEEQREEAKDTARETAHDAKEAAGKVRDAFKPAVEKARQAGGEVAEEFRKATTQAAEDVKPYVDKARNATTQAANQAKKATTQAVEKAKETLGDSDDE